MPAKIRRVPLRRRPIREMDAGAKNWLALQVRKNYWRVAQWMDPEDLYMDGVMHYYRVVDKYEVRRHRVRRNQHIMSLFKITFINHMNDLSKRKPPEIFLEDCAPQQLAHLYYNPPEVVSHAPPLVKLTIAMLMTTAGARKLRMADRMEKIEGRTMTFNEKLCAAVGIDPRIVDLPAEVMNYLRGRRISTYSVQGH